MRLSDAFRTLQLHPFAPRGLIVESYWTLIDRHASSPAAQYARTVGLNDAYYLLMSRDNGSLEEVVEDLEPEAEVARPKRRFGVFRVRHEEVPAQLPEIDYYAVLYIDSWADEKIIALAYNFVTTEVRNRPLERALIDEAHRTLADPQLRLEYDARRSSSVAPLENTEITKQIQPQIQIADHNAKNDAKYAPPAPPPLAISGAKPARGEPLDPPASVMIAASLSPPSAAPAEGLPAALVESPPPPPAPERPPRLLGRTRQHHKQPAKHPLEDNAARAASPSPEPGQSDGVPSPVVSTSATELAAAKEAAAQPGRDATPSPTPRPDGRVPRKPAQPAMASAVQQLVDAQQNRLLGLRKEAEALADVQPAPRSKPAPRPMPAPGIERDQPSPSAPESISMEQDESAAAVLPQDRPPPASLDEPPAAADTAFVSPADPTALSWARAAELHQNHATGDPNTVGPERPAGVENTEIPKQSSYESAVPSLERTVTATPPVTDQAATAAEWRIVRERWYAKQQEVADASGSPDDADDQVNTEPARARSGLLDRLFSRSTSTQRSEPVAQIAGPPRHDAQQSRLLSLRDTAAPDAYQSAASPGPMRPDPPAATLVTPDQQEPEALVPDQPAASLTFIAGPRKGARVDLDGEPTIIGSAQDAGVELPTSEDVAAAHARIWRHGDHFAFKQLDGANTTIAGEPLPLDIVVLDDGDVIGIGEHRITFTVGGEAEDPGAQRRDSTPAIGTQPADQDTENA